LALVAQVALAIPEAVKVLTLYFLLLHLRAVGVQITKTDQVMDKQVVLAVLVLVLELLIKVTQEEVLMEVPLELVAEVAEQEQ
jgi:hypothetical protein